MKIPFGDLKAQTHALGEGLQQVVAGVVESGWYVLGEECRQFENEFATYIGVDHCVGVGSGTDALHLILRAIGVGPGDEVITAPNTCVPTAAAIAMTGARIVLADVKQKTLTLWPQRVEEAITPKTKAIVAVHLYGNPCEMDELNRIAETHGVALIEDAAQAHGAIYNGKRCGSLGVAGAFSFYPSKNLGALGDGGAVCTNDAQLARTVRSLRNYGEDRRYHSVEQGLNSRLDEIQAAVLRYKLGFLDQWNAARAVMSAQYCMALAALPIQQLIYLHEYSSSSNHLYVLECAERDAIRAYLEKQGIGTQIHYPAPLHHQPAYREHFAPECVYSNAERACNRVLSLPLYPELSTENLRFICEAVNCFFTE